MRVATVIDLLKFTTMRWSEDKAPQMGAALAFYSLLSTGPLLLIAIALAGLVFGQEAARGGIAAQMEGLVGPKAAEAIQSLVASAHAPGDDGLLPGLIGAATLLIGASGVFGELQDALNAIWKVKRQPGRTLRHIIKERFLSFAMVLGMGFLLLVSLILSATLDAMGKYFVGKLPALAPMLEAVNALVTFGVITLLFAMIFKLLPDTPIHWRDVWAGALLTGLMCVIGKCAIGLYLGRSTFSSAYGAAGSIIVLALWVYYSAQILFFGAELTHAYALHHGSRKVQNLTSA